MMMVRLNTQHELPRIAIRQTAGRLDETAIIQPQTQSQGNARQARSNKGTTQPSLSIDSYPSRKAYGFRKMGDLTAEQGSRGISDAQAGTSRHAQEGWAKATTAARPGNDVPQNARAEMFANHEARIVFTTRSVPNPQMQGHPGQVVGQPDLGDVSINIQTAPTARIHYTPGSVETYLQNEGFIRNWVSVDHYEIYA